MSEKVITYDDASREKLFNQIRSQGHGTIYNNLRNIVNTTSYTSPHYRQTQLDLKEFQDSCSDLSKYINKRVSKNKIKVNTNVKICFLPKVKCKRDIIRAVSYLKITRLQTKADYLIVDIDKIETHGYYYPREFKKVDELFRLIEWKDLNKMIDIKNLLYYNCTEQKTMTKEDFRDLSSLVKSKDDKIATVALSKVCDYKIEDSAIYLGFLFNFFKTHHRSIIIQDKPEIFMKYYDIFMGINKLSWALSMDLKHTLPRISELPDIFIDQYIEVTSSLFPKGWRLVKDKEPEEVEVPVGQVTNWEL